MNTDTHSIVDTPGGRFRLLRYPSRPGELLRAWNSADLLLLDYAAELEVAVTCTLVVNDEFGALSVPLKGCTAWLDSQLSVEAISRNNRQNDILTDTPIIPASEQPAENYELVLLKIPKQLSLLRYQLRVLREVLPVGTPVICAGMDKHLPRGVADIIEQYVGPTRCHQGQRKARLFSAVIDKSRTASDPRYRRFLCPELSCEIDALPNVFSGGQLDAGSRLLMSQIEMLPNASHIVDLGCGSGVLGLAALQRQSTAGVVFIDESNLAVESARNNINRILPAMSAQCRFVQADGFLGYRGDPPELVLCNPPFHQQHVVDDYSGRRLLRQTRRVLAPGGELWLVGNRHLPYGKALQRDFASVTRLLESARFIVWRALKAN